jgi:hypothetical protein
VVLPRCMLRVSNFQTREERFSGTFCSRFVEFVKT